MAEILDRLIQLLTSFYNYLIPFAIAGDDQVGVVRRLGKYHRLLEPGFNWKYPLIEQALVTTTALDSTSLEEQSLTTKDNVCVTLRGVMTYRVVEPRRYILGCATAISVMNDAGCLVMAELVSTMTADEVLRGEEFPATLLRKVRARAKRLGVEVDSVGFIDRVAAPAYRIIMNSKKNEDVIVPGVEL